MPVSTALTARSAVALAAACWLAAACSKQEERAESADAAPASADVRVRIRTDAQDAPAAARAPYGRPTFAEGEDGSVSIHTQNGAMVMSLRHDSIVVAFSDSVRATVRSKVRQEMNKDTADVSALGEVIKGVVQSSVSGALHEVFEKARGFPTSTLRAVAYEEGAIRFDFEQKPTWSFDGFESDGEPLMSQFHPADAARFVGAVRATLRQR